MNDDMVNASGRASATPLGVSKPGTPPPMEAIVLAHPASNGQHLIEEVALRIFALRRDVELASVRAIGALLVDRFFHGDPSAMRARRGGAPTLKALSDALARLGERRYSPSYLHRCVAFVELEARLGPWDWRHLTLTHVRAVFGLPEPDQRRLLGLAESERWTVAALEGAATALRDHRGGRRGRPPLPPLVKAVHEMGALLRRCRVSLAASPGVDAIDHDEARGLQRTVRALRLHCEHLERALEARAATVTPG